MNSSDGLRLEGGLKLKTHQFLNFFRSYDLISNHSKVYIFRKLKYQKIIESTFVP